MINKYIYILSLVCFIQACEESDNSPVYQEPRTALMDYYEDRMNSKNFSMKEISSSDALQDSIHIFEKVYTESVVQTDSNITILFKFISPCCQEYLGEYSITNDSLIFSFEQVNTDGCSCLNMYEYKVIINEPKKKYSFFKIERKASSSFSDSLRGLL